MFTWFWDWRILKFNYCRQVRTLSTTSDKWLLERTSSLPPRFELPCSGIVRLTSRWIFKMALSIGGTILRESLARHRATPPCTRLPPFLYERVVLCKERQKSTRGETRIAGRTRETRNDHPIIVSLTKLLSLLSNVCP